MEKLCNAMYIDTGCEPLTTINIDTLKEEVVRRCSGFNLEFAETILSIIEINPQFIESWCCEPDTQMPGQAMIKYVSGKLIVNLTNGYIHTLEPQLLYI